MVLKNFIIKHKEMRYFPIILIVLGLLTLFSSCKKDESAELAAEPGAEIVKLTLKGNRVFETTISNLNIVMKDELGYLVDFVLIDELRLSDGATADKKVGDTLFLAEKNVTIKVTASEPNISQTYNLTLRRDEGLGILPNRNLEATSSYELQVSDVYVDAFQLIKAFDDRFYLHGYGDFNGDGHTDVLISSGLFKSYTYSPVYLYYGDGSAVNPDFCECGGRCSEYSCNSFVAATNFLPENFEGMQHPRKIITGDYNNDGRLDAYLIGHGYDAPPFPGESPIVLINNGNGFDAKKIKEHVGFDHGGASADIDNDGDTDLFTLDAHKKSFFLLNDGKGNFTVNRDRLDDHFFMQDGYYTSELIDVDQDGYMDLILAGHEQDGAATIILWGNSYGKYFQNLSTTLPTIQNYKIVFDFDAEDIDGDGDRDIILSRVSDNTGLYGFYERHYIQVLENVGDRKYVDKTAMRISDNEGDRWRVWIHLQDLDGDGDTDIYYQGDHDKNEKWLNNGQGVFTRSN